MCCIAHRGFAGVNPENTVRAARAAVDAGADWIEIDVRRCGSGELVVFHDENLDRLTDVTGAIAETPLSTLRTLDVLGGGSIPTLPELFGAVPESVGINVELKERGLADDCLAVFDSYDNDVLVSAFDPEVLRAVRDRSEYSLALLFASDASTGLDRARELGCRAVHPNQRCCDPSFVDTAHDAGFRVHPWTVRSEAEADRLDSLGVDGLIADAPRFCRDS